MSVEENKSVVRRYFDMLDTRKLDRLPEVMTAGFRLRFDSNPEMDVSATLGMFTMFIDALPDVSHEIVEILGEDNAVAVRMVIRGTHRGNLMGIPPTQKSVEFGSTNFFRFEQGKIAEQWAITDMLGMMRQLGVIQ